MGLDVITPGVQLSEQQVNLSYHETFQLIEWNRARSHDFSVFWGGLQSPCNPLSVTSTKWLFSDSRRLCLFWLNSMSPVADQPGPVVLREDGAHPTAATLKGSGWSQENLESASENLSSFPLVGAGNSGERPGSELSFWCCEGAHGIAEPWAWKELWKSAVLTILLYCCLSALHLSRDRKLPCPGWHTEVYDFRKKLWW